MKEIDDLKAVLDPRNGCTDNGCILIHEKVLERLLKLRRMQRQQIAVLRAHIAELEDQNEGLTAAANSLQADNYALLEEGK